MKDEQWVSTFGTARGVGQDRRWRMDFSKHIIQNQNVVYGALWKIRRIYWVRIDWV